MQKIWYWILDRFFWLIDLGFGEIITPLTKQKKTNVAYNLAVIFFLIIVTLAIVGVIFSKPYGSICWFLLGIYLFWNVCLDEYSGQLFQPLRQKIMDLEQHVPAMPISNVRQQITKFFYHYIRLAIPGIFTILTFFTWSIL